MYITIHGVTTGSRFHIDIEGLSGTRPHEHLGLSSVCKYQTDVTSHLRIMHESLYDPVERTESNSSSQVGIVRYVLDILVEVTTEQRRRIGEYRSSLWFACTYNVSSYHLLTHRNTNTRTQARSSDNHVEMSPVSFSDIAYTSVVSRVAVTITNTSKSKTISNMRLSTSNSKLLWFEFMSEYSSDEDDDNDEEEDGEIDDENGDKDTQRPQRTKSNEEELIAIKHDDDPERSELIGTDADAYEDEDNLSFRRHPRSAVDVLTKKSSKDVIVDEGMPSKHRRYVEDLPKLGPQRTMTLYLCFCPEASASSHLMLQSKHFRVFLHGEQNVVLCSVAGTAKVASSLLETATNRIQCSDVRHVTIRNLSIVKTHIRIEGPSASASSFLIRPRHLVLEAKSSERITVTRVQSRVSSCRANYVLKNMDGGNSLKLEVVSAIEASSSNSKTEKSSVSSSPSKEENDTTYQDNDKNISSSSKTVSSSPTTYPAVNIDMGHVTGDYPLCSLHRLDSSLELSWDEERTYCSSAKRENANCITRS